MSTESDTIFLHYLLGLLKSVKEHRKSDFGPSVSSPLIHRDSFETKNVQVGGGLSYELTKR